MVFVALLNGALCHLLEQLLHHVLLGELSDYHLIGFASGTLVRWFAPLLVVHQAIGDMLVV